MPMTPKKSANIAVEKLLRNNRLGSIDSAGLKIDIFRFSWVGTNFLGFVPKDASCCEDGAVATGRDAEGRP
jgi:hypothetical protein